jgi:histidinol dehydrogenase
LYFDVTVPKEIEIKKKNPNHKFHYSDVDLLKIRHRRELKMLAKDFVESIQQTGDDGLFELAENYIGQTVEEARMEALTILAEQNKQLEEAKLNLVEKVEELQEEVKNVRSELEERDVLLLDSEMTTHLTAEAKELAV